MIAKLSWLLSCVVLCASLLATAGAAAQTKRNDGEYQKAIQQALHEFDLGNFNEAKAFFTQAHAISPNARTLRGLGMSSYELRNYVEAIDYFEQSLRSNERPLTVQMRGEVSQLLKQARAFVTRLRITLEPGVSAELRIDTRPVSKDAQGEVLIDPGSHELVAEAPQYETTTRSIRTDGGEELTLTISLQKIRESSPPAAAEVPAAEPIALAQEPAPGREPEPASAGPWILIGSSAAVSVAGGVMIGLMLRDKSFVENAPPNSDYSKYRSADGRVLPLSIAGFVCAGVGLAGLIGGLTWKLLDDSDRSERASARFDLLPGGVRLSGRF